MSITPYSFKFQILILKMLNKSLPHIIFNKWTFMIWCPIWWQYVQRGKFGLGTLSTLWIPLFHSLGTPLTMLPLCWLNLGSLYLTFITTWTCSTTISFAFGKTIVSCIVTSTSSIPLEILIPWVAASCSMTRWIKGSKFLNSFFKLFIFLIVSIIKKWSKYVP